MKKTIFALALSLVFVLTLFPAYTFAEDDVVQEEDIVTVEEQTQEIPDVISAEETAEEVVASEDAPVLEPASQACKIGETIYGSIKWALEAAHEGEGEDNPTVITMIEDDVENVTIPEKRYITLDLNGHVLKAAADGRAVITVGQNDSSSASLTINDSDPTATHADAYESLPAGGIITGGNNNQNTKPGGGICNFGTLTMNGGTIIGNKNTNGDTTGGGVYNQGTFTMNEGVVITENTSTGNGGGVSSQGENAHFIMNGGKITGNTSSNGGKIGAGGGVYNQGTFEMYGGEISGNTCGTQCGGGVDNSYGAGQSMILGGTAVIKNNTNGNLYNEENKYVTVATGDKAPVEGKMYIGVTLATGTGAVTTASSADFMQYFHSDNTDYSVYNNGKGSSQQVCIGNPVALIVETGIYYNSLSDAFKAVIDNQTIQMIENVSKNIDGWDYYGKTCTLDLNGYVLSPNSLRKDETTISVTPTSSLTITDSRPTEKHTGSYASLPDGGVITGCESESGAISNSGRLTIIGGTITGNQRGVHNNCYTDWSEETQKWYQSDGFLYIGGTAKITGNTDADGNASNVYLDADVDAGQTTITVGTKTAESEGNGVPALAEGASIGVTMADGLGQFTSNGTENDKQYFFSDNSAYVVDFNDSGTTGTTDDYLELTEKKVCKIGSTKYKTIAAALAAAHEDEGEKNPTVITMIADDEENVTIPEKRYITLDLNGYVLKGTGSGTVITTSGNLTIKDSRATDKPRHYFTEAGDGTMLWTWNGDIEETDYYVEGGVITGVSLSQQAGTAPESTVRADP